MNLLITGAAGRLGNAVAADLNAAGHRVLACPRTSLDITNETQVAGMVDRFQPDVIVNCSAYNAVDQAEVDASAAYAINAHGPSLLADAANRASALFVHFSSDFVFDGTATEPYSETAAPHPLSVYGASKLAGEIEAGRASRHYVLRVESNFGGPDVCGRRATIDRIADNLIAGQPVKAFADRTVSPSYVFDVAQATRALIESHGPFGIYHCVNSGHTTWYDLAVEIARQLRADGQVLPAQSSDVKTPAIRPQFCALSNRKLRDIGIPMPSWESAIERHLSMREAFVPAAVQR